MENPLVQKTSFWQKLQSFLPWKRAEEQERKQELIVSILVIVGVLILTLVIYGGKGMIGANFFDKMPSLPSMPKMAAPQNGSGSSVQGPTSMPRDPNFDCHKLDGDIGACNANGVNLCSWYSSCGGCAKSGSTEEEACAKGSKAKTTK